jgi:outer membrane lipoprotein SlyB
MRAQIFTVSLRAATAAGLLAVSLTAAGCAGGLGSGTYSRGQVGQVGRTDAGVVIEARPAMIEGTKSGVGTAAGAVIGGAGGSQIGQGDAAEIAGGVAGAVIGGLIGAAIEEGATRQAGYTYMVRLDRNGEVVSITQADQSPLPPGAQVWVEYGQRARVVPRYSGGY